MTINKQELYYATYQGKTDIIDTDGNITGDYTPAYSNPIQMYANISAARGETEQRQFGENLNYDKVIVVESSPIDEYAVLWIDTLPTLNGSGETDTPYDYVVTKVAKSLNSVSIAVRKVDVDG